MSFDEMMQKAKSGAGFLAALDQSGGSTPKALKAYGVPDDVSERRATRRVSGREFETTTSKCHFLLSLTMFLCYRPGLYCW